MFSDLVLLLLLLLLRLALVGGLSPVSSGLKMIRDLFPSI
jgi:hypothetical protein